MRRISYIDKQLEQIKQEENERVLSLIKKYTPKDQSINEIEHKINYFKNKHIIEPLEEYITTNHKSGYIPLVMTRDLIDLIETIYKNQSK